MHLLRSRCWSTLVVAVVVAVLASACRDRAPRPIADPPPAPSTAATTLPDASQVGLARELDLAEQAVDGELGLDRLRQRWQGQRLQWTVTRVSALCASEARCHVVPFASARAGAGTGHGWLPALTFAAGQFARLEAGCGDAAVCELTFVGTLDTLRVSFEAPTALSFAAVEVVSARRS